MSHAQVYIILRYKHSMYKIHYDTMHTYEQRIIRKSFTSNPYSPTTNPVSHLMRPASRAALHRCWNNLAPSLLCHQWHSYGCHFYLFYSTFSILSSLLFYYIIFWFIKTSLFCRFFPVIFFLIHMHMYTVRKEKVIAAQYIIIFSWIVYATPMLSYFIAAKQVLLWVFYNKIRHKTILYYAILPTVYWERIY